MQNIFLSMCYLYPCFRSLRFEMGEVGTFRGSTRDGTFHRSEVRIIEPQGSPDSGSNGRPSTRDSKGGRYQCGMFLENCLRLLGLPPVVLLDLGERIRWSSRYERGLLKDVENLTFFGAGLAPKAAQTSEALGVRPVSAAKRTSSMMHCHSIRE